MRPSALFLVLSLPIGACESAHTHADASSHASHDHPAATGADAGAGPSRDLTVRLSHATTHPERLCEVTAIDDRGSVIARAALRGHLMEETFTLRGIPSAGGGALTWFCDDNGNALYDPPPTDRAGRSAFAAGDGAQTVSIATGGPTADIGALPVGGTLNGRFSEFEVHAGVYFELTVSPLGTARTLGFYRYRAIAAEGRFDLALRAILRERERYTARWFIDLNDNGVYDQRGDHGGTLDFDGAATSVTLVHLHHQNRAWTE